MNKICRKCKRELPANTDYFFKKKDTKDGFADICKECRGKIFTNKLTKIPKEGYKFCIKCDRELLIDIKYFSPDKLCKDGFRNVCRECSNSNEYFKEEGYKPKKYWTKEEDEFFIKVYPNFTNEELVNKYYPDMSQKQLWDKAYRLGISFKNEETIKRKYEQVSKKLSGENSVNYGKPKSEEIKLKISLSKKGRFLGENSHLFGKKKSMIHRNRISISRKYLGFWSGDKNPRHINPLYGKSNGRWQGGIKQLYLDLRENIQEWKISSIEECNYKCVLTQYDFDNIHHLYSFKNIVDEVFDKLNLPRYQTIGEYSLEEKINIYSLLNELHRYYGNGKCLCKPLHLIFHNTFGYFNNTVEQFEIFTRRYINFEFDYLLEDKYKYCNIIKAVS